jgi:ABC-2 type transport system permease protein
VTTSEAVRAPLGRLVHAELSDVLSRGRTRLFLVVLAVLPLVLGIGVAVGDAPGRGGGPGPGLVAAATANGLGLPVATLSLALQLLLPLGVVVTAADALSGRAGLGSLRRLLLAPVGRTRVVLVKAAGVVAVSLLAVLVTALVGTAVGLVIVGGTDHLLTLSGSEVDSGQALRRIVTAAAWTVLQLAAVGAVALAVAALTERALPAAAAVLGALVVGDLLTSVPALGVLHPWLLPACWPSLADLLREPVPVDDLRNGALLATGYLVLGLVAARVALARRDV